MAKGKGRQTKKVHHSRPHGGDSYAARQQRTKQVLAQAVCDTYSQYVFDCTCMVLNETFGFGRERLQRYHAALAEMETKYQDAIGKGAESGYMRTCMDRRLQQILGEIEPFEVRYQWTEDIV